MVFCQSGLHGAKWLTQPFSTDRMSGARWAIIVRSSIQPKDVHPERRAWCLT